MRKQHGHRAPRARSRSHPVTLALGLLLVAPFATAGDVEEARAFLKLSGWELPPGLDDQWLISMLHTDADVDRDGDVDLIAGAPLSELSLLVNDGLGHFVAVASLSLIHI